MKFEEQKWQRRLEDACFPVILTDVLTGNPVKRSRTFRAIVRQGDNGNSEPFAIVTDRYRLIRNDDALDLGLEAFEQVFGPKARETLTVFNVIAGRQGGTFLADLTAPTLECRIAAPNRNDPSGVQHPEGELHKFFLRVTNSYNKTQAVRIETGVCRWICRNGMIFGTQSIRFRDPHHRSKVDLMDDIARTAKKLAMERLPAEIGATYGYSLDAGMNVQEGIWQTLRLAVPSPNPSSRNARHWINRCRDLLDVTENYERNHGSTVFSVLQGAAEWARSQTHEAPIQRHSYERRCGEMLDLVQRQKGWPAREKEAQEQMVRIQEWAAIGT